MPEWLQVLVGIVAVAGPAFSAWWATRRAAVLTAERWGRLEETLRTLDTRLQGADGRLNNHADRIRRIEIGCAARHGNGRGGLLEAEEVTL